MSFFLKKVLKDLRTSKISNESLKSSLCLSVPTHVCRARCSPGAACGPSWSPPGCIWWQRSGRRCRRSCCRCRRSENRKSCLTFDPTLHRPSSTRVSNGSDVFTLITEPKRGDSEAYVLKLSLGSGAGGGVLAHAHGGVSLIHLTHFTLLAVIVQAGICAKIIKNNNKINAKAELKAATIMEKQDP